MLIKSWKTLPIKISFVYAIINEIEIKINNKEIFPKQFQYDLIDLIREILTETWEEKWTLRNPHPEQLFNSFIPIEIFLRPIRDELSKATKYWLEDCEIDTKISLELALKEALSILDLVDRK